MSSGLHYYTKGGNLKKASYAEVAKWVSAAWKAVQPSAIISGVSATEIIPLGLDADMDIELSDDEENSHELDDI